MSSINKTMLMGRLGADPEVRRLQSGDPVVSLRIATSDVWRDKATGERKEKTEWHTVVIFNTKICEIAEKYLKKGNLVYVEGALATRKWEDQTGSARYSTEIVLKQFNGELKLMPNGERQVPSPEDYGSTRSRDSSSAGGSTSSTQSNGGFSRDLDDEIPF